MGLFSSAVTGEGWTFDKKSGVLTITGDLTGAQPFAVIAERVCSVEVSRRNRTCPAGRSERDFGACPRPAPLAFID